MDDLDAQEAAANLAQFDEGVQGALRLLRAQKLAETQANAQQTRALDAVVNCISRTHLSRDVELNTGAQTARSWPPKGSVTPRMRPSPPSGSASARLPERERWGVQGIGKCDLFYPGPPTAPHGCPEETVYSDKYRAWSDHNKAHLKDRENSIVQGTIGARKAHFMSGTRFFFDRSTCINTRTGLQARYTPKPHKWIAEVAKPRPWNPPAFSTRYFDVERTPHPRRVPRLRWRGSSRDSQVGPNSALSLDHHTSNRILTPKSRSHYLGSGTRVLHGLLPCPPMTPQHAIHEAGNA